MNLDNLIPFLLELAFVVFVDIIIMTSMYKNWIKKKGLEEYFKLWKGTKKTLFWYISWSVAVCINLVFYIVFALLIIVRGYDVGLIGLACLFSVIVYPLAIGAIYLFIKWNIKARHNKKE